LEMTEYILYTNYYVNTTGENGEKGMTSTDSCQHTSTECSD